MKKAFSLVAVVLIMMSITVTAFAERYINSLITLTFPEGWEKEDDSYLVDPWQALYCAGDDSEEFFISCSDMWEAIPDEQKEGLTRADLNNDLFTAEYFEEQFAGAVDDTISVVKEAIGDREYYVLDMDLDLQVGTYTVPTHVKMAFHVDNGYFYMFRSNLYEGTEQEGFYSIIESAEYKKSVPTSTVAPTAEPSATGGKSTSNRRVIYVAIAAVVVGAVIRKAARGKKKGGNNQQSYTSAGSRENKLLSGFETVKRMTNIVAGGSAELSPADCANGMLNTSDALRNLPRDKAYEIRALFEKYILERNTRVMMDFDKFVETTASLYREFDAIAPLENYVDMDDWKTKLCVATARGDEAEKIRLRREYFETLTSAITGREFQVTMPEDDPQKVLTEYVDKIGNGNKVDDYIKNTILPAYRVDYDKAKAVMGVVFMADEDKAKAMDLYEKMAVRWTEIDEAKDEDTHADTDIAFFDGLLEANQIITPEEGEQLKEKHSALAEESMKRQFERMRKNK